MSVRRTSKLFGILFGVIGGATIFAGLIIMVLNRAEMALLMGILLFICGSIYVMLAYRIFKSQGSIG